VLDLSILNKEQKEAVETTEGPVLVLAGAGSGKTRVLTYRIAYILDSGLAGPNNILAMTFTNKAAGEMRERIEALLRENGNDQLTPPTWMGTFHSIGVRILKRYGEMVGIGNNFSIYDSADQLSVIKEAMKRLNISIKEFNPNAIKTYISSAKNQLINDTEYESMAQGYFQQTVAEIYPVYQKILRENNSVDFDDLIMLMIKLLKENPKVLESLQENFKYILVDEYQDTNHAQYMLINMLAAKHKNLCCVGDDDQSIYSFRGATIKNILSFEKDYPDAKTIKLEQNYRSTGKILEASYQVISKNKSRKDKKLWTDNQDGEPITIYTGRNEVGEANWIAENIIKNSETEQVSYNEFAILYRTNSQSRSIEEAFINYGIPYRIVGGTRFYERKEIKDILAYLKLVFNPMDSSSLERIINVPRRGIGKKAIDDLKDQARKENISSGTLILATELDLGNAKLNDFAKLMRNIQTKAEELNVVDLINYILEATGYIRMLDDGTVENADRIENIKELVSVATKFINESPSESLENFLEEVSLLEGVSEGEDKSEAVTMMTIHAAKGLEFDYVYVIGVEENLFPHSNSMYDDKELEEERRLAYVAITRAKKNLALTNASTRVYFGKSQSNPPSRFLFDIDKELVNFESGGIENMWDDEPVSSSFQSNVNLDRGERVKHEYFGIGTVVGIDDEMIEVDFGPTYGIKELMMEYARLEKVN
jgi:DNA helicase-2/ATP-dependent DNA helicase PcrA